MVSARGGEQAPLEIKRRVLERILEGPEAEDPAQRTEDGRELLAVFGCRIGRARAA